MTLEDEGEEVMLKIFHHLASVTSASSNLNIPMVYGGHIKNV